MEENKNPFDIVTPYDGGFCVYDLMSELNSRFNVSWKDAKRLMYKDELLSTYKKLLAAEKMGQMLAARGAGKK